MSRQPQPDPRLSEKNFGMPMPPGGTTSPEWPETRRKDGDERPKREPVTHGIPDPPPVVESKQRPASGYEHPFKIVTGTVGEEIRLYVCHGAYTCWGWAEATPQPYLIEVPPTFQGEDTGNGPLLHDPLDPLTAPGYKVLPTSGDYGVWVVNAYSTGTPMPNPMGEGMDIDYFSQWSAIGTAPRIEISTTQISPFGWWTPEYGSEIGHFIGLVSVFDGGSVAIKQWRKSDIIVPVTMLPASVNFPTPP